MMVVHADTAIAHIAVLGPRGFDKLAFRTHFETLRLLEQLNKWFGVGGMGLRTPLVPQVPWVGAAHRNEERNDQYLNTEEDTK